MGSQIVEWAPFRLKPGVDETDLLKVSDDLQTEFLNRQSGFLRRELFKASGGNFVDVIWWSSRAAAQNALASAADSPACGRYFQLMQDMTAGKSGTRVSHYLLFKTYLTAPHAKVT
jgi:hypothetical protein